jgi:hypothetical protein
MDVPACLSLPRSSAYQIAVSSITPSKLEIETSSSSQRSYLHLWRVELAMYRLSRTEE